MATSVAAGLLAILSITSSALAQDPPIQTSDTFVLYPYITSGELTGPYPNSAIDKSQPLAPSSGRESGTWTSDCFNRFVFTNYLGTHCTGQDQCGFKRWSLNSTYPEAGDDGYTIAGIISGMSNIIIAPTSEIDDQGRRDVGWTASDCDNDPKTPGFTIESGDEEILHLKYENQEDESDAWGTFFACWVSGEIYGPKMFYRNSEGTTPEDCAELLLVPRCTNDTATGMTAPVKSQCYQGGLPA